MGDSLFLQSRYQIAPHLRVHPLHLSHLRQAHSRLFQIRLGHRERQSAQVVRPPAQIFIQERRPLLLLQDSSAPIRQTRRMSLL